MTKMKKKILMKINISTNLKPSKVKETQKLRLTKNKREAIQLKIQQQ